jgi:hypothetical protein
MCHWDRFISVYYNFPMTVISPLKLHFRRSPFYHPGLIQQALVKSRYEDTLSYDDRSMNVGPRYIWKWKSLRFWKGEFTLLPVIGWRYEHAGDVELNVQVESSGILDIHKALSGIYKAPENIFWDTKWNLHACEYPKSGVRSCDTA